jgi:acyl carrier protein
LIDEYFGKKLNANEFKEITTVNDLMEKIGSENFE